MKILIATDSFKGSMTSNEVAGFLESGFKTIDEELEIIKVPISDGGEGLVDSLISSNNGKRVELNVTGPLGKEISSYYGLSEDGKTAYIEVATAIGLYLLNENERNPMNTTTYGVGELILDAVGKGCNNIIVGLGGSSTNDGGMGMARALGVRFLSKTGEELLGYGKELELVNKIDLSNMPSVLKAVNFKIACDVDNPLTGENGATYVFSPQKGANTEMMVELEKGMLNYQAVIEETLKSDISKTRGGGAAGGLGAAFLSYLDGKMVQGIKLVIAETKLEEKIKTADLIITGEGKIDNQTLYGKVPVGISSLGKKYNKKTIAIAGKVDIENEDLFDCGIEDIICITPEGMMLEDAMKRAKENTFNIAKVIYEKYIKL
ncbi:glycerate kinase [Oceanirhabdus seepicola]|uniref:Glycerate kinase n=1 Tax=Oceanirhabdus seepicola TaxID=2828781 RepID=A0A9J6PAC4_9CLOT|nr:glycerate kinase [Oceanirhabdus seepicola]MCM1992184.1 glycerate kinase [Oceanirhabdus seepicola]